MERQIFIKFGHDDVVLICYKSFAIHISFLEKFHINRLRDCCYRFEKVSNDSCIQSLKKHIDYQDICYGCVVNCYDYILEIFDLLLVWKQPRYDKIIWNCSDNLILNGHDYLFSLCFVSAVCLAFILSSGFIIILFFQKCFKNW